LSRLQGIGRTDQIRILPGNKYLKASLGTAALSASRAKDTYLAAKYRRVTARRGQMKAIVAVEHSIITAIWHMLADGEYYADPGADHFTRMDPKKPKTAPSKSSTASASTSPSPPATAA
jgi:transposase